MDGALSLVDGLTQGYDLVADAPVTVIRSPRAVIRGELERKPSLWESVAFEVTRRGHVMSLQMQRFVFDPPLVRAASLLLGLLAHKGKDGERGPTVIELRITKERLAELPVRRPPRVVQRSLSSWARSLHQMTSTC